MHRIAYLPMYCEIDGEYSQEFRLERAREKVTTVTAQPRAKEENNAGLKGIESGTRRRHQ